MVSLWFGVCFASIAAAQDLPDPLTDAAFTQVDPAQARLGQMLFYDPILSGNKNISCATCHSGAFGSADGVALSFGEGGIGVGPDRVQGSAKVRQSRNAPGLWNLGARGVTSLFHDGRVERVDGGFQTPAGRRLPDGLNSVLAAQALFPLLARTEMAGDPGENEIADAALDSARGAWRLIAQRVAQNDGYRDLFEAAFGTMDVDITLIANALGVFVDSEFRAMNTPFDRYLKGDETAMSTTALRGMALFYGGAGCAECHSGRLLSDQSYHALGLPQFGPGLTQRFDPVARDLGRGGVTHQKSDWYRFRTPALRNVALTGPWGHNGAYDSLAGIIRHHSDPLGALETWTPNQVDLPQFDEAVDPFALVSDPIETARVRAAISIEPVALTDNEVGELVEFLKSLTAPPNPNRLGVPETVPSGLPLQ